jgi:hypothetical protein
MYAGFDLLYTYLGSLKNALILYYYIALKRSDFTLLFNSENARI